MSGTFQKGEILSDTPVKMTCMVSFNGKLEERYEVDFEVLERSIRDSSGQRGVLQKRLDAEKDDLARTQEWIAKAEEALEKEKDKEGKMLLESRKADLQARAERHNAAIKSIECEMENLEKYCDGLRSQIADRDAYVKAVLQSAADADADRMANLTDSITK